MLFQQVVPSVEENRDYSGSVVMRLKKYSLWLTLAVRNVASVSDFFFRGGNVLSFVQFSIVFLHILLEKLN